MILNTLRTYMLGQLRRVEHPREPTRSWRVNHQKLVGQAKKCGGEWIRPAATRSR